MSPWLDISSRKGTTKLTVSYKSEQARSSSRHCTIGPTKKNEVNCTHVNKNVQISFEEFPKSNLVQAQCQGPTNSVFLAQVLGKCALTVPILLCVYVDVFLRGTACSSLQPVEEEGARSGLLPHANIKYTTFFAIHAVGMSNLETCMNSPYLLSLCSILLGRLYF